MGHTLAEITHVVVGAAVLAFVRHGGGLAVTARWSPAGVRRTSRRGHLVKAKFPVADSLRHRSAIQREPRRFADGGGRS